AVRRRAAARRARESARDGTLPPAGRRADRQPRLPNRPEHPRAPGRAPPGAWPHDRHGHPQRRGGAARGARDRAPGRARRPLAIPLGTEPALAGQRRPMRYLLIDRIVEFERDRRVVALKNVTLESEVLADHLPGFPLYPGALALESMAQAAAYLVVRSFQEAR